MKVNKYDFILKMFVGDNDARPALMFPGTIKDMVYASDANVVIRFPADLCLQKYTTEDFPNAQKIYEDFQVESETESSAIELLEALYECQFIYEKKFVECDVCDGTGEIECHCCNNSSDCKNCDGEGEEMMEANFSKPQLAGEYVRFIGYLFNPRFLYMVVQSSLILGEEKYSIKKSKTGILLKFGPCEIIIMKIME